MPANNHLPEEHNRKPTSRPTIAVWSFAILAIAFAVVSAFLFIELRNVTHAKHQAEAQRQAAEQARTDAEAQHQLAIHAANEATQARLQIARELEKLAMLEYGHMIHVAYEQSRTTPSTLRTLLDGTLPELPLFQKLR